MSIILRYVTEGLNSKGLYFPLAPQIFNDNVNYRTSEEVHRSIEIQSNLSLTQEIKDEMDVLPFITDQLALRLPTLHLRGDQ